MPQNGGGNVRISRIEQFFNQEDLFYFAILRDNPFHMGVYIRGFISESVKKMSAHTAVAMTCFRLSGKRYGEEISYADEVFDTV